MKYLITRALSMLAVLITCQIAAAADAQSLLEYFSWWEGEWAVETKVDNEVQKSKMAVERHEPGCLTVMGAGTSVWGFDPSRKTWVGTGYMADGSRFTNVLQPLKSKSIGPGVVDTSNVETWQLDGTKVIGESTWTYKDNDTVVVEQTRATASGQPLPSVVMAFKRLKKVSIPVEARKAMSFFIGTWQSETYQGGERIGHDTDTRSWLPGEHAVLMKSSGRENETSIDASGISGWDAKGKQLVERWYSSDGLSATVRYPLRSMQDDIWSGSFTVTFADGESYDGKCSLHFTNEGWTWVARWEQDGKVMERKSVTRKVK